MSARPFPSFYMYQDKEGFWRWSLALAQDQIVAVSALRFRRPEGCARAVKFMQGLQDVPVWGDPAYGEAAPMDELVLSEEQMLGDYETE